MSRTEQIRRKAMFDHRGVQECRLFIGVNLCIHALCHTPYSTSLLRFWQRQTSWAPITVIIKIVSYFLDGICNRIKCSNSYKVQKVQI